jgi:N6-L-threonylcarbamoyladenine synthase
MRLGDSITATQKADLAAATEQAIVDVLLRKSMQALQQTGLERLVVAGGVGANRPLRAQLDAACAREGVKLHYPELALCTDNGAMIALAAAMRLRRGIAAPQAAPNFDVRPRWPLTEVGLRAD